MLDTYIPPYVPDTGELRFTVSPKTIAAIASLGLILGPQAGAFAACGDCPQPESSAAPVAFTVLPVNPFTLSQQPGQDNDVAPQPETETEEDEAARMKAEGKKYTRPRLDWSRCPNQKPPGEEEPLAADDPNDVG